MSHRVATETQFFCPCRFPSESPEEDLRNSLASSGLDPVLPSSQEQHWNNLSTSLSSSPLFPLPAKFSKPHPLPGCEPLLRPSGFFPQASLSDCSKFVQVVLSLKRPSPELTGHATWPLLLPLSTVLKNPPHSVSYFLVLLTLPTPSEITAVRSPCHFATNPVAFQSLENQKNHI